MRVQQVLIFVAVKTGDLSGGALSNVINLDDRGEKIVNINALDQDFNKSDVLKVEFTATRIKDIVGFQKRIVFDTSVLTYMKFEPGIVPGLNAANFGISKVSKGEITVSWNSSTNTGISFDGGELLFTLYFNTKTFW